MNSISRITFGLTIVLVAIITVLTLVPIPAPILLGGTDKTYHFLAFMALAMPVSTIKPKWLLVAIPVFVMFGGAIEIIQPYVGRSRELADWIADLQGIAIGAGLGLMVHWVYRGIYKIPPKI